MLLFFEFSLLLNAILSLIVGLIVLYKGRNRLLNRLWFLVSLAIGLWAFGISRIVVADSYQMAWIWNWVLYSGAIFIPIFYFHFIVTLLKIKNERVKVFLLVGYALAAIFLIFNFSPYFVKDVPPVFIFKHWVKPGPIYYPYFVYFAFYLISSIILLFKRLKSASGSHKQQIKYVLISGIFGFGGGITVFFPQLLGLYPFGSYFIILYLVGVTYAIVKFRLMDIKVVLRKYSVYIVSLTSIISPALGIKYVVNNYFARTEIWVDFLILIVAISLFPALKNYYYRLANKYFFSSLYDDRAVMATLTDQLSSTLEVKRIYKFIADALMNSLHAKAFGILTVEEKSGKYAVQYNRGFAVGRQTKFAGDENLYKHYVKKGKAIVVEELKESVYVKYKRMIDLFNQYGVEILIPLNVKDKTIGLVAIGAKESGDMYNNEDIQFLETIGAQSAIALENALLFEETKNFGIKLEKEVEKATVDLRAANIQLKRLDQAKSDFVSIASHQLRTPLTVIKGYISMMLEGSFGELGDQEQDSLEKVYESNERLIRLVEDLLNISRIESGRIKYSFDSLQFSDFVGKIVEELSGYAKKRGLRLRLTLPKEKLPLVEFDKEKIRQVVMNLIDNSIKYTRQGTIKVQVTRKEKVVQFCVADTGLGMRPADKSHLFKKFSRGEGMFLVNTEGTGLGLYVAKQMIDAHGGKIWASSRGEGLGSTFCFTLPISRRQKDK